MRVKFDVVTSKYNGVQDCVTHLDDFDVGGSGRIKQQNLARFSCDRKTSTGEIRRWCGTAKAIRFSRVC